MWSCRTRMPRTWRPSSAWWRCIGGGHSVVKPLERLERERLQIVGRQPRRQIDPVVGLAALEPDGQDHLRGLGRLAALGAVAQAAADGAGWFARRAPEREGD